MKFALYLLWRVVFVLVATITSPVWIPVGFVLWFVLEICFGVSGWYDEVKRDWRHKSEKAEQ